jgi:uncharacterized protein (TIGR02145 family)
MKKNTTVLACLFFAIYAIKAQTIIIIYQTNGTVLQIPVNTVDSITYSGTGGSGIVSNPGPGVTFNGYTYSTVILGNGQEWMAENLRTTSYANGDPIPNVTNGTQWVNLSSGAWCHNNNNTQYENPYGKLYNWYAVGDARKICPNGWHVPSDIEWNTLVNYLGGDSVAGGKMKSTGTQYWLSPNANATNESGFSGLPGGIRDYFSLFNYLGYYTYWWSTTVFNMNDAGYSGLDYSSGLVMTGSFYKESGLSVRCLRD